MIMNLIMLIATIIIAGDVTGWSCNITKGFFIRPWYYHMHIVIIIIIRWHSFCITIKCFARFGLPYTTNAIVRVARGQHKKRFRKQASGRKSMSINPSQCTWCSNHDTYWYKIIGTNCSVLDLCREHFFTSDKTLSINFRSCNSKTCTYTHNHYMTLYHNHCI